MLDIKFIKENKELVKENLKKKLKENRIHLVDSVIKNYYKWLELKREVGVLRHKRNILSQEINKLKKEGKQAKEELKQVKDIPNQIRDIELRQEEIDKKIKNELSLIPNIIHSSVPIGKDSSENKVVKTFGQIPKFDFPIKTHVELAESLDLADFNASARTSGNGFYYIKNELALLNQALIRFTIDYLTKKGFIYIEPPLMTKREIAEAAEDFEAFKTKLYTVADVEDRILIPTSEHAILGMLANQIIQEEKLPLKITAYSMCFRKEIGAHGINEKGLWRTHQFNKVEQFIFCKPEDSWKHYEELRKNTEEIFQQLRLPYRIFESCSGDLGDWKAKGEDLEVYRPTTKKYEELTSLSNCTDYQARDLNIKGANQKGEKYVLHTLNNTAIATSRAMVVLLEHYQQKDGSIKIPDVLIPYMNGIKIIKKK